MHGERIKELEGQVTVLVNELLKQSPVGQGMMGRIEELKRLQAESNGRHTAKEVMDELEEVDTGKEA